MDATLMTTGLIPASRQAKHLDAASLPVPSTSTSLPAGGRWERRRLAVGLGSGKCSDVEATAAAPLVDMLAIATTPGFVSGRQGCS